MMKGAFLGSKTESNLLVNYHNWHHPELHLLCTTTFCSTHCGSCKAAADLRLSLPAFPCSKMSF